MGEVICERLQNHRHRRCQRWIAVDRPSIAPMKFNLRLNFIGALCERQERERERERERTAGGRGLSLIPPYSQITETTCGRGNLLATIQASPRPSPEEREKHFSLYPSLLEVLRNRAGAGNRNRKRKRNRNSDWVPGMDCC